MRVLLKNMVIILTCLPFTGLQAQTAEQSVTGTAGGSAAISGYTIDFTVGETIIQTAGVVTVLTQGFLQPSSFKDFPVAALNLMAIIKNNAVQLDWITTSETNNDRFYIERSGDGLFFQVIDSVYSKAPNGNSTSTIYYRHVDLQPLPGANHYRIRQVSKSGLISYSSTVMVNFQAPGWSAHIYPNPVHNQLKIKLHTSVAANATVRLVNMIGQVLLTQQLSFTQGYNDRTLWLNGLKNGIYILTITDDKGRKVQVKLLKQ